MFRPQTHKLITKLRKEGHALALVKHNGPKLCVLEKNQYNILTDLSYSEYLELSERGVYEIKKDRYVRRYVYTH